MTEPLPTVDMLARMILGELAGHDGSMEQRDLERAIVEQVGVPQSRKQSDTQKRLHHAIHWAILLLMELDAVVREDAGPFTFYVLMRSEPDAPEESPFGKPPRFMEVSDEQLHATWRALEPKLIDRFEGLPE